MYTAVIVFVSVATAILFCGLGYCIYRINKLNNEVAVDLSASDIELAHTTGWSGENI